MRSIGFPELLVMLLMLGFGCVMVWLIIRALWRLGSK
jgi:hypothetical protein